MSTFVRLLRAWSAYLFPTLALATFLGLPKPAAAARENVVFILLDATRADHFGAWGNPRPTTPWMDRLGADGAIFRWHFANAHATRASMPQLMSGRYYGQTILRPFAPKEHPREYSFSRRDPTAALLPQVLRLGGYRTLGVSAHPWVVAESTFGEQFDRLEFTPATPERGHADAAEVMDRALALWRERDVSQPLFLYIHLMDMHMPRFLPDSEPRFAVARFDWRERFQPRGEPTFNHHARRWAQNDARAFTEQDRQHFEAVYDTRLAATDEQIGRLLTALRRDDPELRRTIVVVTADHGEELGEDGRTEHLDSLADGVQHVPWILSGGPVAHGQRLERMSEHVDVTPTLLTLLRLPFPDWAYADGRSQLDADGRLCAGCGKAAVYFAYEDYRGMRTRRYLLRRPEPGTFQARCAGEEQVYRIDGARRVLLDEGDRRQSVGARLRGRLARRLDPLERAFRARRYGPPAESFLVRSEFWHLPPEAAVACVPVDEDTDRGRLGLAGWLWSGRGLTVLHPDAERPLPVTVPTPAGTYKVDIAIVRVEDMPWESGLVSVRWLSDFERARFARWRARNFLPLEPSEYMPLGEASAANGSLTVKLPAGITPKRIVGVRLTPPGVPSSAPARPETTDEKAHHERLKALGYVN